MDQAVGEARGGGRSTGCRFHADSRQLIFLGTILTREGIGVCVYTLQSSRSHVSLVHGEAFSDRDLSPNNDDHLIIKGPDTISRKKVNLSLQYLTVGAMS